MTDVLVELSRVGLMGLSFAAVMIYASYGRWVTIWHALTFVGLAGFFFVGWNYEHAWLFFLAANFGTTGVVLWMLLYRRH